ncbi:MAG: Sec-independent protein translocase protein TatB [Chromatocurvus sp.]
MFDIGFAELIIIGVVGLLVIGPERLPGAIRTASVWLGRLRRGFNDIKREVQQELHNDEVMQELRRTGEQVKQQTEDLRKSLTGDSDETKATERKPEALSTGATPDEPDKTDKTPP